MIAKVAPGELGNGSYAGPAGERAYQLFVPREYRGQALPLLVMLHGCKQSAADFAAGTRMHSRADEYNCFVLYPEQSKAAINCAIKASLR